LFEHRLEPQILMAARRFRIARVLLLVLLGSRGVPQADGALITSFQSAFQPTTPAPGWAYLWNNAGPIGNPANYTPLLPTAGGRYTSDGTDILPAPPPGRFVDIGLHGDAPVPGGHPGVGALQSGSGGIERYAIAVFTVASPDSFAIVNGLLRNVNPNSGGSGDGLNVKVFTNDNSLPMISTATAPGFGSQVTFDGALGALNAGDTIYVAIGSKDTDLFDGFALEYDIVTVPEPNGRSLIVIAAGLAMIVAEYRYRRANVGRSMVPQVI
jgi:hypothetical protein